MESSPPQTNSSPPGSMDTAAVTTPKSNEALISPPSPEDTQVNASSSSEKPPPQPNPKSNDSTLQSPNTGTSKEPSPSGAHSEVGDEKDDDDLDSETPKFKRGRPGNPGTWKPEQVTFMEEYLPAYLKLQDDINAKGEFFATLLPAFLAKFPKDKYPPPEPSKAAKEFKPLPAADVEKMDEADKKAYKKREKRAFRNGDERLLDRMKNWYSGRQHRKNVKSSNPFKFHFKNLSAKKDAPKKSSLAQFVIQHEDYKDEVKERSEETGPHDRLPSRVKAAHEILAELDSETVKKLVAEADEQSKKTQVEVYTGAGDEPSDGTALDLARELDMAACRRNLTPFVQPLLDFIREHTGMVCFFQAGYEKDHPDQGQNFEIVSLSSVPSGTPRFPDHNIPFFGQFGREFAKWVRTVKKLQLESGVEFPVLEDLEDAGVAGKQKNKGKGKAQPAPASKSAPASLPSSRAKATPKPSSPPTSISEAVIPASSNNGRSTSSASSSSAQNETPSQQSAASSPQSLPQPPSTEGMSIYEKQAAYRAWHRELAEAMGLKDDVRNLFVGKDRKESANSARDDDDDEYEGEDEVEGFSEVSQRNLRPRKGAKGNGSTVISDLDSANAIIHDSPKAHTDLATEPAQTDSAEAQPTTEGEKSTSDVPHDACKSSPPISRPSSSRDELLTREMGDADPTSITPAPIDRVDPVVMNDHGDAIMNTDSTPGTSLLNARVFEAIELPFVDPYPPESLKNGSFVREYATLLLKTPEGEPLPAFWFTLVHGWIELEGKWESLELEPKKLPKDLRPQAFAAWFQAGRTKRPGGRVTPALVQLPSFRDEWWSWFNSLNPDWRVRSGNIVLPGGDGDWDELEYPGKDGFALLLIGLRWWFDRGGWEDKAVLGHWEHAVRGLYDTIAQLQKYCDIQAKETQQDGSGLGVSAAGGANRQEKVRKSPDSLTDDGPDSHRAKRRA